MQHEAHAARRHLRQARDDASNGKVASFRVINDTFDAAEQFLGHRINVESEPLSSESDVGVVAV